MMNTLNRIYSLFIAALFFSLVGCGGGSGGGIPSTPPSTAPNTPPQNVISIKQILTDRASYLPNQTVTITVRLESTASPIPDTQLKLSAYSLDHSLDPIPTVSVIASSTNTTSKDVQWTPPTGDFRGYLMVVELLDNQGKVLDRKSTGVDVSSDWTKFPRYGYLTDFSGTTNSQQYIEALNQYHINAIQFYDWQWKHHLPIKGNPNNPDATWPNIANNVVTKAALTSLISAAHQAGMKTMQYNLIYGAADHFSNDNVNPNWGLFNSVGGLPWVVGPFPSSWATSQLTIFNPANTQWQQYLFQRELEVFNAFAFDGWHADTVGDQGIKYDFSGNPVDIKTTFKPFLTAARQQLGSKYLVMNAVGAKGHAEVNSSPIDVAYMELWPWDGFTDYQSVKDVVDQTYQESNGKSLVVAGYMNYNYGKNRSSQLPGLFNDASVLLTNATIFAAGGSHIEIGDIDQMLCNEYFPNRNLKMSDSLKKNLLQYYDFLVAYQNILRDGTSATNNQVEILNQPNSSIATPNKIFYFTKQNTNYEILHLINFVGALHSDWLDTNAQQTSPTELNNIEVKYYYSGAGNHIYFASPDMNNGVSQALIFTKNTDSRGDYLRFFVPQLRYWSMLYLPK